MKLDNDYINSINCWENIIITIDDIVTDVIKLNFGVNQIELVFKFPRFKNFCYNEAMKDYTMVYTKDKEGIELCKQLLHELPYCKYMSRVERHLYDTIH